MHGSCSGLCLVRAADDALMALEVLTIQPAGVFPKDAAVELLEVVLVGIRGWMWPTFERLGGRSGAQGSERVQ